ncbi:transforming growth factor-beta receptor-associated protein 1 isoform X2 [Lepisosteus oculatus]|uniref:transforming growth factor-beta receptor-associated protein 1 isoform X2 n=1 Tax=Lepisosteus oculatus TaxID=7918 RepID=UPI0035F50F74
MSLKVFSLSLVIESHPKTKKRDTCSFQCMEACGKNLYFGTKDCVVQHFVLPDESFPDSEEKCPTLKQVKIKQMGMRRPVTQLKASPELNHLILLCDNTVTVLNMFSLEPVQTMRKIQNVSSFHVNETATASAPDCIELFTLSSKKKSVHLYMVSIDKWERVKEVSFLEEPLALAVDGNCLCVATSERYVLHDYKNGTTVKLFPHNREKQATIVELAGRGEFLLNGPGSLGMFVTKSGISQRPPVKWTENLLAAAVHFPYIVTLESEALRVHSILDQQQKQTLPLHKGRGLLSTPENVFVLTENTVYSLTPVPVEEQLDALLKSEKTDEALDLVQGVKPLFSKDTYKVLYSNVTRRAGFVKFHQEYFSEAKDLFIKGNLDPKEIISLYPELSSLIADSKHWPNSARSTRDLRLLKERDSETFEKYTEFLCSFLRDCRLTEQSADCREEVDRALVKLYAERGDSEELIKILSSPNACKLNECATFLEKSHRFFALGCLYQSHGHSLSAIQTWTKIVDGHHHENMHFDVYSHIVDFLCCETDLEVVWKYADWVLKKNQEMGVHIFTKRKNNQKSFVEDDVLNMLKKYSLALILYLEYLVNDLKSEDEKHHTLLVTTYVDQILVIMEKQGMESGNLTLTVKRNKLQDLLQETSIYNTAVVQDKLMKTGLHVEKAILNGRAGQHEKALWILVNKEQDICAAENYCRKNSLGRGKVFGNMLFLSLLKLYLDSVTPNSNAMVTAAVDLLNNNAAAFDPASVLQVIPDSWSLQLISRFLVGSLRSMTHYRRMGKIERNLAQAEHLLYRYLWQDGRATRSGNAGLFTTKGLHKTVSMED